MQSAGTSTRMELDDQEAGTSRTQRTVVQAAPVALRPYKRKVVDEFGNEVPDSKRNRAVPEVDMKMNAFKLVAHWHEYLRNIFDIKERNNIDDIADLTSVVQTVHTKFRQESNGFGAMKDAITDAYVFTAAGKQTTFLVIKDHMKKLAEDYGFKYINTPAANKTTGTLSSLLGLFVAYRHRFTEVRLGNTSLVFRKTKDADEVMELGRFGLTNSHCSSLSGCRFTPSVQSAMKQSLGPMTIAINLCMNTDPRYQQSWKEAFVQAFKLIPHVDEIAKTLAGSRTKCKAILRLLGDISLFGVTRTSNKACLPVSMLLVFLSKKHSGYKERYDCCTDMTPLIEDDMIPPNVRNLDFSGHGLLHFWNHSSGYSFQIRGDPTKLIPTTASQLVFHAVFGSHKENLNLVKWMTGTDFLTRREIGDAVRERSSSGLTVKVQVIRFVRFSKLASASMTQLLRGGMGAVARGPTWSGRFEEDMDADRDFFKVVQSTQTTGGSSGAITEARILAELVDLKDAMIQDLTRRRVLAYGTTDFHVPLATGDGSAYGDVVPGPGLVAPRYFYQQD